ncbi:hypothetical protein LTR04_001061, partial [Oleoguttula sp. CCFEE 6159]
MFYGQQAQGSNDIGGENPQSWISLDVNGGPPAASDNSPSDVNNAFCDIAKAKANATNWTIDGKKIQYCLAKIAPPECKLQFS